MNRADQIRLTGNLQGFIHKKCSVRICSIIERRIPWRGCGNAIKRPLHFFSVKEKGNHDVRFAVHSSEQGCAQKLKLKNLGGSPNTLKNGFVRRDPFPRSIPKKFLSLPAHPAQGCQHGFPFRNVRCGRVQGRDRGRRNPGSHRGERFQRTLSRPHGDPFRR